MASDAKRNRWMGKILAGMVAAVIATAGAGASAQQQGESTFDFEAMAGQVEAPEAEVALDGCRRGQAVECFRLGVFYHGGDGVPRDNPLSNRLIEHACGDGHRRACYSMGVRYYLGIEVEPDRQKARGYFERVCTAGGAFGCHMLARSVEEGLGGPRNLERAERLFERSCRLGYGRDCRRELWPRARHVGMSEAQLPDSAPDRLIEAARQCDSGLMDGCRRLGRAYRAGRGVEEDRQRALALYASACDWGDREACSVFRMMEGTAGRFD
jgi:hypothetical protein